MPEKIAILARMIIFPNTNYPESRAFIIACVDINMDCYLADTDEGSLHKDFWSKDLTSAQKAPAIQGMLNALEMANGHRFRYIQPLTDDELDQFPSSLK
jgi:hypothetical protein